MLSNVKQTINEEEDESSSSLLFKDIKMKQRLKKAEKCVFPKTFIELTTKMGSFVPCERQNKRCKRSGDIPSKWSKIVL